MTNSVTTEAEREAIIELIQSVCKYANNIDDISSQFPRLVQLVHTEIIKKETAAALSKKYSQVLATILCSSGVRAVELIESELNFSLEALQGKSVNWSVHFIGYRLQK